MSQVLEKSTQSAWSAWSAVCTVCVLGLPTNYEQVAVKDAVNSFLRQIRKLETKMFSIFHLLQSDMGFGIVNPFS